MNLLNHLSKTIKTMVRLPTVNITFKFVWLMTCMVLISCGSSNSSVNPGKKPKPTKPTNPADYRVQIATPGMVSSHLQGTYCYVRENQKEKAVCEGPVASMHGDGDANNNIVALPEGETYFAQVHVGAVHVCGLTDRGNVYCWGSETSNLLGSFVDQAQHKPLMVPMPEGATYFTDLAVGHSHSCALADTKDIYCWGLGTRGQLGDGLATDSIGPVKVDFSSIDINESVLEQLQPTQGDFSCVTTNTYRTFCWGDNSNQQIFPSLVESEYSYPTEVQYKTYDLGSDPNITFYVAKYTQLQSGLAHSCGLTTIDYPWSVTNTTTLVCFGDNTYGQITKNNYVGFNSEGNYFVGYPALPQSLGNVNTLPNLENIFVGYKQTCGTSFDEFNNLKLGCWRFEGGGFLFESIEDIQGTPLIFDDEITSMTIGAPTIGMLKNGKIFTFNGLNLLNDNNNEFNPLAVTPYDTTLTSLTWHLPEEN